MMITLISILSIVLNLILIGIIAWLILLHFRQQKRIKQLVNELGADSLEHYLKEIKKRGFDFTLKPKQK